MPYILKKKYFLLIIIWFNTKSMIIRKTETAWRLIFKNESSDLKGTIFVNVNTLNIYCNTPK